MNKDWLAATSSGDVQQVIRLLDAGAHIDALDRYGQTALMNAAHRGDTAMVRTLVDHAAKLDHTAKYRLTALMLAVVGNHPEVVRILLTAGADRRIPGNYGDFARTPLEYAKAHNLEALVALLTEPGVD